VLIFTSNLGTQDISKAVGMGFSGVGEQDADGQYDRMKGKVNDELKKHFRPEFLNRIDEIVVFHQLTRDQIVQMVELLIDRVAKALAAKDMGIELTDKAKALLAQRGFDPVLGARPLRRTIQREIEDTMSEKILFGELGAGEIVTVDVDGWDGESKDTDSATFTFTPRPKPLPEGTFSEMSPEAAEAVRDVEADTIAADVPDVPEITDDLFTEGLDEGPAGAGSSQPQR
jgi:ATP-dependent Clp protease ATP-binding subunit ClpC